MTVRGWAEYAEENGGCEFCYGLKRMKRRATPTGSTSFDVSVDQGKYLLARVWNAKTGKQIEMRIDIAFCPMCGAELWKIRSQDD